MSNLLEAREVSFSYGLRSVLQSTSVKVAKGQCTALLGPNGAGKTTLLRLLSGTLQPQQGELLYKNSLLSRIPPNELAKHIAVVPQDFHLPFDFTVAQVVEQGRTPHRRFLANTSVHDRSIVEAAMQHTGVLDFRTRIFNELSGGERQRVRIAMALAQQPELLLLDEPLQQLDLGWQAAILDLIRTLNQGGITIVAAIHDLNLVQESCFHSAVLLQPGKPAFQGALADVLRRDILEDAFGTSLQFAYGRSHVRLVYPSSLAVSPPQPSLVSERPTSEEVA